jgi:hypothetical protein
MIRPRAAAKTQHRHILVVSVVLMEGGPTQGRPPGHDVARARHPPTPQAFFFFHPLARQLLGCVPVPPSRFSNYAPLSSLVERPLIANGYSDTGKESARGQRLRLRVPQMDGTYDAVLAIARALAPPTREAGVCASSTPTFPPMAAATRALVEDLRVGTSLKSWPTESTRSLVVPQPFFAKAAFHLRRRRLPVTFLPRPSVSPLGPLGGGPEA